MPLFCDTYYEDWQAKKKRDAEKRKKLAAIESAWKTGKISWNEYIRQEKKYRV